MNENKIPFTEVMNYLIKNEKLLDAVVISGGEPTLNPHLTDIIRSIKSQSALKIKLDTNGTNFNIVKKLADEKLIDYVAMDIKAPFDKYGDITGVRFAPEIAETAKFLKGQKQIKYMFRTTLSPQLTVADIEEMGKTIVNGAAVWQLQQFVPNEFSNAQKTVFLPFNYRRIAEITGIAKKYAQYVAVCGL
jgi:pyruvate formate lyase activating enzyme